MNWIKELFSKNKRKYNSNIINRNFTIEYYPITNRYYPKYKKYYLRTNCNTGIIEQKESYLFAYADYGRDEDEAISIMQKFEEQQLKKNVETIRKK